MGATAAPTIVGGSKGATSRMQAQGNSVKKVLCTMVGPASYDVGGSVITQPGDQGQWDLGGIAIINPKSASADRYYVWNGSVTNPLLLCYIFTTGAELGAGVSLTSDVLRVEFTYTK